MRFYRPLGQISALTFDLDLSLIHIYYLEELERHRVMQTQEPPKGELPITGVYSMGSTSSVGESCSSDQMCIRDSH